MKKFLLLFCLSIFSFFFFSPKSHAQAACDHNPPGITIVPDNRNRNGSPGEQVQYTIKVKNRDQGTTCQNIKFTLTKEQLPSSNWTGSFSDNTLIIAKQQTKSTTFKLKSPATATAGKKTITLAVKPEGRAKKSFAIYYTVVRPDPSGPTTPTPTRTPQPSTCQRVTPEITITKNKTYVKPGGGTIKYTVKVKNVDLGPCSERAMRLTKTLRNDNWKGNWDPNNTFTFSKGQTRSKDLLVTSPNAAPVGTYTVKVNLFNDRSDTLITSKTSDFVISNTAPTPTPTPTAPPPTGGSNTLNITIGADGLGVTKRIPLGGNLNPEPDNQPLNIWLYKTGTNNLALEKITTFTFNAAKKKLVGSVNFPADLAGASYDLFIMGERYLYAEYPLAISLNNQSQNVENENFNLIAGNINNDGDSWNKIDLLDYNVLISCSIYSQDSDACDVNEDYRTNSDLNFDGQIDEDDYTLFLKEVANQEGAQFPGDH